MKKIPVGILGATGTIGQQYLSLLKNHPWFEIGFLSCSREGSVSDIFGKKAPFSLSPTFPVNKVESIACAQQNCSLIFSALPQDLALVWERRYAERGFPVISSASAYRLEPDIPLIIPEINAEHLEIIFTQRKNRGWEKGYIVAKPNCALHSFVVPLTPLHRKLGLKKLSVTTLQAISGAGMTGLSALSIHDNVIPFISGEEKKLECEPLKLWGTLSSKGIEPSSTIAFSVHCNRVPVSDGHLACVSASFEKKTSIEEIEALWKEFSSPFTLPSLSSSPLHYLQEEDRPQPSLDRHRGNGMCVSVGRLRPCTLFDYRFVGLSHNTIRGGAGLGIAIAELLYHKDLI